MKLPKLPRQWEALDSFARDRIGEVTELAIDFLVQAGYNADSLDENGEPIADEVQSLLMDAMLRAPHLYLHISQLVEITKMPGLMIMPGAGAGDTVSIHEVVAKVNEDFTADQQERKPSQQWGPWGPDGRQGN